MKIQDFFKEGFYINLDDRVDRQTHMSNELTKYGLSNFVQRYSAIKAEVKTPENCVIASGTSHRNIIQYAYEKGLDNVLIFEDDIFFKDGVIGFLEKSLDSLSKINNWDIYYMSANVFDNPLNLIDDNLMVIHGCYCVHAYAINKRAYERVLKYDPKVDVPIDAWLTHNSFSKYGGWPLLVSQIDSISDNVGGFIGYDKIFTNVYDRPIRRI
jgi:GR25 family glycosyltransferase involved in LPS biosynthesis